MNICEQAEAFRLLLLMGTVEKSEIIAWADGIIEAEDSAPNWLLDVSLAANGDAMTIESKLRDLPGEWSREVAAYGAIERFAEEFQTKGRFTSASAAEMLATWAGSAKVNQEDWTAAMLPSWLADEVSFGNASDLQVIESIDACIEHFEIQSQTLSERIK